MIANLMELFIADSFSLTAKFCRTAVNVFLSTCCGGLVIPLDETQPG